MLFSFLICVFLFFFPFSAEAPHTYKRVPVLSNEELRTRPERSWSSGPDHQMSVMTEMFVTDENVGKMENILDTWGSNLKVSQHCCWRPRDPF